MPFYDYRCDSCGPFTTVRPMARSGEDCACPECGEEAPRAFFTMPFVAGMDAGQRNAFATNERARHEPKSSKAGGHGPGCGCCSSKKPSKTLTRPDGSKSFPTARPWQISH